MTFKNLLLNREKIHSEIEGFAIGMTIEGPVQKDTELYAYKITPKGDKPALVNFYYTKDGMTTIDAIRGKNLPLSYKIAEHIKGSCEQQTMSNRPLYLKKILKEEFEVMVSFLADFGAVIEDGKNLQYGKQYKITGPYGDHVILNKYDNGALQIQGNGRTTKISIVGILADLLPYKDIIEVQLKSIDAEISTDEALAQMQQVLPNSYAYLGSTLITIMSPSVVINSINTNLLDYSVFVFPAFKGLEGYLKKLFKENGIIVPTEGFRDYFDTVGGKPKVKADYVAQINNPKVVQALENGYNFFRVNRHSLFHVDAQIETTRIINNRKEAHDLLYDIFQIIEDSYSSIIK